MVFILSSQNVIDYLIEQKLFDEKERASAQITAQEYKNFNLRVSSGTRSFLVKQERPDAQGNARGDFWDEWRVYELFQHFPDLQNLSLHTSEILHFDSERSILVLSYLDNYIELRMFYDESQTFPWVVASNLGKTLAMIHQSTFKDERYKDFLTESSQSHPLDIRRPQFLRGLERIGPGVFSHIRTDGLDFWRLYQRYESLHLAMVEVSQIFTPCCLTHNDLNLQNILVELAGDYDRSLAMVTLKENPAQIKEDPLVRLIDWEFVSWGDPAFDLGMVLSNYLKLWLGSLIVSNTINIETALRLAATPLEKLQPSLLALVHAYLEQFPKILEHRPNFLQQVMQFTGLILVKRIQGKLEQLDSFDNTSICILQVAKTLLCKPGDSISMVLGATAISKLRY
jgi:Phosphotransferase enzyme family